MSLWNGTRVLVGSSYSVRRRRVESILKQEFLYAGTHDEFEKVLRRTAGGFSAGPNHRFTELDRRVLACRSFINDADLATIDRIGAVDDAHLSPPGANQIHDIFTVRRVDEVRTVSRGGIEGSERLGRDFSQGRRLRIDEGNADGSIRKHFAKGN